jgi:hypothetical protein
MAGGRARISQPQGDRTSMEKLLRKIWHLVTGLMEWFFRLLHIRLSEGQWEALKQFVKFGMIGVTNTAVSYCIYLAVLLFLQRRNLFPDTDYLIGNVLSVQGRDGLDGLPGRSITSRIAGSDIFVTIGIPKEDVA